MLLASPLAIVVESQEFPTEGPEREALIQAALPIVGPFIDVAVVARFLQEGRPLPFPLTRDLCYPLARFENER